MTIAKIRTKLNLLQMVLAKLMTIAKIQTKLNLFKIVLAILMMIQTKTRTFSNLVKQATTDRTDEKRKTTGIFESGQADYY